MDDTTKAILILAGMFWSIVTALVFVWYGMLFSEYCEDKRIAAYTYPELRSVTFRQWLTLKDN